MSTKTISIANMTQEERIKLRLHVESQQDGGNPSQFLELLAYTVENHIWEQLQTESGKPLTFRRLVELPFPDGIGSSADNILTLITLQHKHEAGSDKIHRRMEAMRQEVRRELHEPMGKHGGLRQAQVDFLNSIAAAGMGPEVTNIRPAGGMSMEQGYNITLPKERGTSESYTIRRLRRDNPELAKQVIAGKMSANEAAIVAGFRKQPIYVPDDVSKAARVLARHFDVTALIDALAKTQTPAARDE